MLITENYKQLNQELHRTNLGYGVSGHKWANHVTDLAMAFDTKDVLDYGCGKSTLAQNIPFKIKQYDPAINKHSEPPELADIVACTDVLEHIEPECLDSVLDDLKRLTKKACFLTVATRPAKKTLADGRNAHLIQEDYRWWLPKILDRFELRALNVDEGEFVAFVTNKTTEENKNALQEREKDAV